ncbi:MAG: alpha-xylosidase, partial [Anaerolineae bacterium]
MSEIPDHFQLPFRPVAAAEAVVVAGSARFTVLTSRLIRLEYAANGRFVDQASQLFWYRQQPVPPYKVKRKNGRLQIITDHLRLNYEEGQPFSTETLAIVLKESDTVWHYGQE